MKIQEIEKSLKRFLKKKGSFSVALLVMFLITGTISLGAVESVTEINGIKGNILVKIKQEREKIKAKIKENESKISEETAMFDTLVKEWDFYGKPLGQNTQVFFTYDKINSGSAKDRTTSEFSETINVANKFYGENMLASQDRVMVGNGIVTDNQLFRETVDLGANIKPIQPVLPIINPNISINVSIPNVNLGQLPGGPQLPSLNPITAPIVTAPTVGVIPPSSIQITPVQITPVQGINPITLNPNVIAPTVEINEVNVNVTLNIKKPTSIVSPKIDPPANNTVILEPNVNPFADFKWEWLPSRESSIPIANTNTTSSGNFSLGDNINVSGGTFWSGVLPDGTLSNTAKYINATQGTYPNPTTVPAPGFNGNRDYDKRHLSIINSHPGRWTGNATATVRNNITGGTFHVAGNVDNISDGLLATGTEVFHLVGDVDLNDIEVNLYGKAAFINFESFRGGQITMNNVDINIKADNNTIFNIVGHSPAQDAFGFNGGQFSTKLEGNADIKIDYKDNTVYALKGFAGGLRLDNKGDITFNGASNIGFSFLTWVPDKSKYIGEPGAGTIDEINKDVYIPFVNMDSAMKMYGDENVGLFFSNKLDTNYNVGIHQGYFNVKLDIGTQLNSGNSSTQTDQGNLNETGYTDKTVDGNVGVYAKSGQRTGVNVMDLADNSTLTFFNHDPIHNLYMDDFKINFGKYSKNGFMFLAKNGTVIEIKDNTSIDSFSDGINDINTLEADTGTGIVIAYAEGTWTATGTGLQGSGLEGKPTEILVNKKLNMMSKEGIAFFAKDGGKITVTKDSEGHGYSSIMGYADKGIVEIKAGIKAIDAKVASEDKKYTNIGGYATNGGRVSIDGNAEIHGIGAFANGISSKVELKGTGNIIRTGVNGGLAALGGGVVEFGGGIIIHKDIKEESHSQKLPFYADDTSKIDFKAPTTIEMFNGAIFSGKESDYQATTGLVTKYNGMENVTIALKADGINLGLFKEENITWNGENQYLAEISTIPKITGITNTGDFWYNSYLEGGTMTIAKDVNLAKESSIADGKTVDKFNDIIMEREKVTINSGINITSQEGKGLVLGSNITANTNGKNLDSGYTNNGTLEINGGNEAGIYVSYGYIDNNHSIKVDKGIAAIGVNGSKITNKSSATITVGDSTSKDGIGIVGLTRKTDKHGNPDIAESYGTDTGDATTNVLEISNSGTINVNGESGIGIYANNNVSTVGNSRTFVENIGNITVGNSGGTTAAVGIYGSNTKISNIGNITVGEKGVAINATNNSLIEALGTLKLGTNGIGVRLDGTSDLTATAANVTFISDDLLSGKTGIYYEGTGIETKNVDVNATATALEKGTVIYGKDININSSGTLDIGKGGIGIYIEDTNHINKATNKGTINLGVGQTDAIGMYTESAHIINDILANINVDGSSQIAMFAKNSGSTITNKGNIALNEDGAIGIYAKTGAIVNLDSGNIIFNAKSSVGVLAEKANINITNNLTFSNNNDNKNIYVYGKDARVNMISGIFTVDGGTIAPTIPGNKTVGIYLENLGTDENSELAGTGKIEVKNQAVGIYSKGDNNLTVDLKAQGEKTTGIFVEGNSSIDGTITTSGTSTEGATGIYGTGGTITVTTAGLSLDTVTGKGTGMYLTDGASVAGGTITVKNTANTENIALYYNKGTANGIIKNEVAIKLENSKNIGIYAANGIILENTGNIETKSAESNNIASFVGGNSQLTSIGNITMNDADSIGLYVEEGKGINSGIITMNGTATATNSIIGMIADAKNGKTSVIENTITGDIIVKDNIGMYIANGGTTATIGINTGINKGDIAATSGIGVYASGSNSSFDGTNGTITTDNGIGIYLENTGSNKIKTGNLNANSGGVGVYGDNAKIDFSVNLTGDETVGVIAKNNSLISNNVTTGNGSIGVFLLDDTVTFNNANIETGTTIPTGNTSVGIFLKTIGNYTINNVSINAKDGVGIYLDNDTSVGSGVKTLTHTGEITTVGGIGVFIEKGNTFNSSTSVINIDGGTGVYIAKGGIANLGTTGNITFNFLSGGGTGIFNQEGTLNLGANITLNGLGTLVATLNGNITSTGNNNIGEKGIGLFGQYGGTMIVPNTIDNNGIITAVSGGIGIAAIQQGTTPSQTITINNNGTINASGLSSTNNSSIGIYTDVANIVNTGEIIVGNNGIGIYSLYKAVSNSITNDKITMTGTDGIGVYINGTTNGLASNAITSTGSKNTGVVLANVIASTPIDIGTITLGNESIGVMSTGAVAGHTTLDGTIVVKDSSSSKSAIGIVANKGSKVTLASTASIDAGKSGIGVYADGAGTTVIVPDMSKIKVGVDGIYLYSKDADLTFTGNITANNQIGIVAEGGNVTGTSSITALNGGIGVYVKGATSLTGPITIAVQAGTVSEYSIGAYYDGVSTSPSTQIISQTGNYTIGMVLNNSTITSNNVINIGGTSSNNQVGLMAKGNSTITVNSNVSLLGDKNIGTYGEDSHIRVNGDITISDSTNASNSSIGASINGGSYVGTGNLTAGNNSIGVFGKKMQGGSTISQGTGVETMTVGDGGLGMYGEGSGTITANMSTISIGANSAIGVYGKGMDTIVNGDMTIGANTSIGIVSEGNGNITYTGSISIADKGIGANDTASVGIYKIDGTGTINTLVGNWTVGNSGYGIYLKQSTGQSAVINNHANILLGMSAVGIYSEGNNTITNSGNITVGETDVKGDHNNGNDHLNSIGMYLTKGTNATNSGTITINYDHSVGVYGQGIGTIFTNTGDMNVDNGGVGILVRDGAIAINKGDIILGNTSSICGASSVGMAAYTGARLENEGTITVNSGVGMLLGSGTTFSNTGTIFVKNGIGIEGAGALTNTGNIVVTGTGVDLGTSGVGTAHVGAIEIELDGTITINGNYTSIGGTLSTVGNVIVNGAYVDVTTGIPLFNANNVSGEINILPNFALTGNGISYEIEGFLDIASGAITGTKLTPITSPLFVSKITNDGSLIIVKRPYADITLGNQFESLEQGLDNILANSGGVGRDAEILKNLNHYLGGVSPNDFGEEMGKAIAETRGDIYGTIQGRMQDVNRAFDNSFDELLNSYNPSRQSDKFSVLYTEGDFKDPTLGVSDYDYDVKGLLYMHEKDGLKYGTKYGYTLGFAGSEFKFDDDMAGSSGSKEDIYSFKVGAHREQKLGTSKFTWLTRGELAYNYHDTERNMQIGPEKYDNKAGYSSYGASFKNELSYTAYSTLSTDLKVYGGANLEYGAMEGFTEKTGSKGGLELEVKGNDYFIGELEAGLKGSKKIYLGKNINLKVSADAGYAYDLGDNYPGNKAKLKNGGEGYYDLITTEKAEGSLRGKVGLGLEKANHYGVTFEVEWNKRDNRSDEDIKYSARLNYKF